MPEEMNKTTEVTEVTTVVNDEAEETVEKTTDKTGMFELLAFGTLLLGGIGLVVKKVCGRKKKDYAEVPATGEYFSRK